MTPDDRDMHITLLNINKVFAKRLGGIIDKYKKLHHHTDPNTMMTNAGSSNPREEVERMYKGSAPFEAANGRLYDFPKLWAGDKINEPTKPIISSESSGNYNSDYHPTVLLFISLTQFNRTLHFLLTKVKTLWPGKTRNNTSNRSPGIWKSVNTNSIYSASNDQQTSDEPYPLTSVISVTEASAFADAWAGELPPSTKADLRRADVLIKRELGRSMGTLASADEGVTGSDQYRGSSTRDFAA